MNGQPIPSPQHYFRQCSEETSPRPQEQQFSQNYHPSQNLINNSSSFNNNGSNLDDDVGPPWTCRSCTFQNHALLQKCETCDTVRVLPGMIRITSSSSQSNDGSSTAASASASAIASFLTNNTESTPPPFAALHT